VSYDGPIRFISQRVEYGWLSNFAPSPIRIDDFVYATVEHAFQAAKTQHHWWRQRIREAATPKEAKQLGKQCPLRADWEQSKVQVMFGLVWQKFTQNPELAAKLKATGDRWIEEDAPWDAFWGTGYGGKGENHLGTILMDIRAELRRQEEQRG
jgi:ribA/ribD-fused uncharacterized protein